MNGLKRLGRLLFPPKCLLCGTLLGDLELDLCRPCRIHAPEFPPPKNRHPYLDSWLAMWYYEGDVRRSLLRYKFYGKRNYARSYGRLLAMRIFREWVGQFDVVTWVPISRRRKLRRGYDQVELLARAVGRELGIEPVRCLRKHRHTPPQSGIRGAAQRRANVLGAYEAVEPERFRGKRVLLLDDILTTGATMSECARVLLTAGALEVHAAAIAAAGNDKKTGR